MVRTTLLLGREKASRAVTVCSWEARGQRARSQYRLVISGRQAVLTNRSQGFLQVDLIIPALAVHKNHITAQQTDLMHTALTVDC